MAERPMPAVGIEKSIRPHNGIRCESVSHCDSGKQRQIRRGDGEDTSKLPVRNVNSIAPRTVQAGTSDETEVQNSIPTARDVSASKNTGKTPTKFSSSKKDLLRLFDWLSVSEGAREHQDFDCETSSRSLLHTMPIEQGGLSMSDLRMAMIADADVQDTAVGTLCEILEKTVALNNADLQAPQGSSECAPQGSSQDATTPSRAWLARQLFQNFEGDILPCTPTAYVTRLMKYCGNNTKCYALVVGLLYLQRLKRGLLDLTATQKTRPVLVKITSTNIQRLLIVSVMLANKFCDDFFYSNRHWAAVGGIELEELNRLELDFLFLIGFNLNVTLSDYKAWFHKILSHHAVGTDAEQVEKDRVVSPHGRALKMMQSSFNKGITSPQSTTPPQSSSPHSTTLTPQPQSLSRGDSSLACSRARTPTATSATFRQSRSKSICIPVELPVQGHDGDSPGPANGVARNFRLPRVSSAENLSGKGIASNSSLPRVSSADNVASIRDSSSIQKKNMNLLQNLFKAVGKPMAKVRGTVMPPLSGENADAVGRKQSVIRSSVQ